MPQGPDIAAETARRILQDHCTPGVINQAELGQWPAELWDTLEEAGLPLAWVPDTLGGAGAEMADGFDVLRAAGQFAAPVPLAETLMAGFLLACAGLAVPGGPMTVAPVDGLGRLELGADGRLRGTAQDIPFTRSARHIAVLARRQEQWCVALVAADECLISPGQSLAGEPRDVVSFAGAVAKDVKDAAELNHGALMTLGAAVRSAQMAGALERVLDHSLRYAAERVQFGRPIAEFQVIQHALAQLAGEVAAASAAASAAAGTMNSCVAPGEAAQVEVAAAKIRTGEAAGIGAGIAHQVHGAMGFTYEHSLHHATRRLWSWRDEFGTEAHWSMLLGRIAAKHGADGFWSFVTAAGQNRPSSAD